MKITKITIYLPNGEQITFAVGIDEVEEIRTDDGTDNLFCTILFKKTTKNFCGIPYVEVRDKS